MQDNSWWGVSSDNPWPRTSPPRLRLTGARELRPSASRRVSIVYKGTRRTQKKQYAFDLRPWCQFRHSVQRENLIKHPSNLQWLKQYKHSAKKYFSFKNPSVWVAHACSQRCDWPWIGAFVKKAKTWVGRTAVAVSVARRATAREAWSLCRTDCLLFSREMKKPANSRGKPGTVTILSLKHENLPWTFFSCDFIEQ